MMAPKNNAKKNVSILIGVAHLTIAKKKTTAI